MGRILRGLQAVLLGIGSPGGAVNSVAKRPSWVRSCVPVGTPKDIVNKLNRELVAILTTLAVHERFAELGLEPVGDTPVEFGIFLKSEIEKWGKVAKAADITPHCSLRCWCRRTL